LLVVLSLALGTGPNIAIFGLTNAILLRPLPGLAQPDRLVWVMSERRNGGSSLAASFPDYLDYGTASALDGLLAFDNAALRLRSGDRTALVYGQAVTPNFFDVVGVKPLLGRGFDAARLRPEAAEPVAVLGHGFWQRWFGGDPSIVGAPVAINGIACTVIGVAPPDFKGTEAGQPADLWIPVGMLPRLLPEEGGGADLLERRETRRFQLWGRLGAGVTLDQAQAELVTVAARIEKDHAATNKDMTVALVPVVGGMNPIDRGDMLAFAGLLMVIVTLVLLIACANVANLLSMRASRRQKDLGTQLALGATRGRLVRQLLVESVLLFVAGGALGLVLGRWTADVLMAFAPTDRPLELDVLIDMRVVGYAFVLSLLSGTVFGLVSAMGASKGGLVSALKDAGFAAGARGAKLRLGGAFVVAQVTLSVVLLVSAGLFVRTLQNARSLDPGFDPKGLVIVPLDLRLQGYSDAAGKQFFGTLIERLRGLPALESATLTRTVPLGLASGETQFTIEGRRDDDYSAPPYAGLNVVDANYFQTLGIALKAGRPFTERDVPEAPRVAVINETLARRFWPEGSPLGERIRLGDTEASAFEIVGVAADSKYASLGESPQTHIYLSLSQNYLANVSLIARAAGGQADVAGLVRAELLRLDERLAPLVTRTMAQQVSLSLSPVRAVSTLVGGLGVLALVLAAVGVFGVLAYSVRQRTREIGIRMALGAQPGAVMGLVVRQGLRLVLVGEVLGLAIALVLTRFMSGIVFGVSPTDPIAYLGGLLLLTAVAVCAGYVPAQRAAKIDPYTALRQE
jgi:predicted permease